MKPIIIQLASNTNADEFNEIIDWLNENVGPAVTTWMYVLDNKFSFVEKKHALLFKLTWGGS